VSYSALTPYCNVANKISEVHCQFKSQVLICQQRYWSFCNNRYCNKFYSYIPMFK